MKKLILIPIILLISLSSCTKNNSVQPSNNTNSSTSTSGYVWGSLIQLQGHYHFVDDDITYIAGHLDPNPDGTIGFWREVVGSTQIDGSGGEYKFDTKRLYISGISASTNYLNGEWQVNTYNLDYSDMTLTRVGTSVKMRMYK